MYNYVDGISEKFSKYNYKDAHYNCREILETIAHDKNFLINTLINFMEKKKNLSCCSYRPFIIVPIWANQYFSFSAHLWLPLPKHISSLSHQSIHHHGKLLLSSVSPYGEGYESVLFKPGWEVDPFTREATLQPDKYYKNKLFNLEFIDEYTPHVVFYPESFSVTYALWSKDRYYLSEKLKYFPIISKFKEPVKKIISLTGSKNATSLNLVEDMDFFIRDNKCYSMKKRIYCKNGTNQEFINNFLYSLQTLGFKEEEPIHKMKSFFTRTKQDYLAEMVNDFLENKPFECNIYSPESMSDVRVNIPKQQILDFYKINDSVCV